MEECKRQMNKQLDIPVQVKCRERKLVTCLKSNKKEVEKQLQRGGPLLDSVLVLSL